MKYFIFTDKDNENRNTLTNSSFVKVFDFLLSFLIPKANPDFDSMYDNVITWFIEYDEDNDYTNREVGVDKQGRVIVKAPYKRNLGFWVDEDLTFQDYVDNFNIQYISKEAFESIWEKELESR